MVRYKDGSTHRSRAPDELQIVGIDGPVSTHWCTSIYTPRFAREEEWHWSKTIAQKGKTRKIYIYIYIYIFGWLRRPISTIEVINSGQRVHYFPVHFYFVINCHIPQYFTWIINFSVGTQFSSIDFCQKFKKWASFTLFFGRFRTIWSRLGQCEAD